MRKVACKDVGGLSVEDVLQEFNERREEFGIEDEDIISISTRAAGEGEERKIAMSKGTALAKVIVTIFYWSSE
jgi:hypothetical protein